MSTSVSSLSPESLYWQIMAILNSEKHHGVLPQTGLQHDMFQSETPHHAMTRLISTLVNVKLVAAKVKGGEAVVKGMTEVLNDNINGMFMPGDDASNTLPPWWKFRPPGPNPYLVAAGLTEYANLVTDKAAQAEFNSIINTISSKIAQVTAG